MLSCVNLTIVFYTRLVLQSNTNQGLVWRCFAFVISHSNHFTFSKEDGPGWPGWAWLSDLEGLGIKAEVPLMQGRDSVCGRQRWQPWPVLVELFPPAHDPSWQPCLWMLELLSCPCNCQPIFCNKLFSYPASYHLFIYLSIICFLLVLFFWPKFRFCYWKWF